MEIPDSCSGQIEGVRLERSEADVLQACQQTGFRCVRLSQVADALRELAGAPFLSAHIAEVREERHGSVVVARTLRANERAADTAA